MFIFFLIRYFFKNGSAQSENQLKSQSLMCHVDFLIVLTQDETFYMDMKLQRFTSLVNLGDKRENTDVFVLFSPILTAHLILTLCLILTFPWDRSRKNHGNTITFVLQNSKLIFGMCSRTVYCTFMSLVSG